MRQRSRADTDRAFELAGHLKQTLYEFVDRHELELLVVQNALAIPMHVPLGIALTPAERDVVLQRVIELGDRKSTVGPEDLPYIIADVLKTPEAQPVHVESYEVTVATDGPPRAQ